MALTVQRTIELLAPEFSSDARIADLTTLASQRLSSEVYGGSYNQAVALQVLHYLAINESNKRLDSSGKTAYAGAIASQSEGDLSVSFGGVDSTLLKAYPDLCKTQWGLQLIELTKENAIPWAINYGEEC